VSVESLAMVLHHSRARGTAKLVLIGIANHEGDGGSWPAVGTLATYANVSRINVQRSLTALEKLGELHRATQDGGLRATPDWDRPNLYRVLVKCPPNCDHTTAHRMLCIACGKTLDRARRCMLTHAKCDPVSPAIPRIASDTPPVSPAIPEPSFNPTTYGDIENDQVLNRAGGSEIPTPQTKEDASGDSHTTAGATACPRWTTGAPHAYSRSTGRCIDCGHQGTIETRRTA
jgi:hypothetical protein